jgi:hypothetical protein
MKIAFLTEMGFDGKIPSNHPNMRTEFAWMYALDAEHKNIHTFPTIQGYDHIFVIFPKGKTFLSAEGSSLSNQPNPVSGLLASDIVTILKQNNKKVYYMQEGPHWWYNDYELADQINFYNLLASCDAIFAHNEYDTTYYKGLVPNKPVYALPTLMIEDNVSHIVSKYEEKAIIGGNFARWYGGFESYLVAQEFGVEIWGQTSHAMRNGEEQLFNHLPRVMWNEWINQLSQFKYAVHLMPTVAAGTFSLNCAYLGIPCIGNKNVDTQRLCHPELSVDIADIESARELANRLTTDQDFYNKCSQEAKENYNKYYKIDLFKQKLFSILNS